MLARTCFRWVAWSYNEIVDFLNSVYVLLSRVDLAVEPLVDQPTAGSQIFGKLGFGDPQAFDQGGDRILVIAPQGTVAVRASLQIHETISE
jgi:hypothetical protein